MTLADRELPRRPLLGRVPWPSRVGFTVCCTGLAVCLLGCADLSPGAQRMMTGTMIGAGSGAAIGAIAGNAGMGAGIGAAAGLLGGYLYDQHEKSKQQAYQQGYAEGQQAKKPNSPWQ